MDWNSEAEIKEKESEFFAILSGEKRHPQANRRFQESVSDAEIEKELIDFSEAADRAAAELSSFIDEIKDSTQK